MMALSGSNFRTLDNTSTQRNKGVGDDVKKKSSMIVSGYGFRFQVGVLATKVVQTCVDYIRTIATYRSSRYMYSANLTS